MYKPAANFDNVFVSQHPIVAEKIALTRDQKTDTKRFRELFKECGSLLGYEATADLKLVEVLNVHGTLFISNSNIIVPRSIDIIYRT
jgi:uracil phosphoribosyltransferase